jgi:hypothetical protein
LVNLGAGQRGGLIVGGLRRALGSAFGRRGSVDAAAPAAPSGHEAQRRIDAARRRLQATIPPPEDNGR